MFITIKTHIKVIVGGEADIFFLHHVFSSVFLSKYIFLNHTAQYLFIFFLINVTLLFQEELEALNELP